MVKITGSIFLFLTVSKMAGAKEVSDRFNAMIERLHVKERYDGIMKYICQNPVKAMFVSVSVLTCLFPILVFLGFILATVVFGLMSLLLIEGKKIYWGRGKKVRKCV